MAEARATTFQVEVFGNTMYPLRASTFQVEVFGNTMYPLRVTSFQVEVFGDTAGDAELELLEPGPPEILPLAIDNPIILEPALLEAGVAELLPLSLEGDIELELPLLEIPEAEILTLTDSTLDLPLFDLPPTEDFPLEIIFSVDLPLLEIPEPEILPSVLESDSFFELPLFDVSAPEILALQALAGHEVELSLLDTIPADCLGVNPYLPAAQSKRRAESQRSAVATNIVGIDGPFRLNPSAVSYYRGGPHHTVHLTKAKPEFVEVIGVFELLTPYVELEVGEFFVQSPGGYLTLQNIEAFFPGLVPDEDDAAIDMTQIETTDADTFAVIALTSLPISREELEE